MTRKRFIKLMMAKGFSRNSAKKISLNVVEEKRNYAEVYAEWERLNTAILEIDFTEVATAIVTAIKSTVEVIAENLIHYIRTVIDRL